MCLTTFLYGGGDFALMEKISNPPPPPPILAPRVHTNFVTARTVLMPYNVGRPADIADYSDLSFVRFFSLSRPIPQQYIEIGHDKPIVAIRDHYVNSAVDTCCLVS
jgi:hypothetical protein